MSETNVNNSDLLELRTSQHESIPLVVATGDVDLCTAPQLRGVLEEICSRTDGPGTVAVDMQKVLFIDSAGLALLVDIRKRFFDKCRLALVIQKGSQPERVLRLGRFDTFLQVAYNLNDLTVAVATTD